MTYRQRVIAMAKEAHHTMLTTGKRPTGLFLAVDVWTFATTLDGPDNILQRQWVVELKDNGSLKDAYSQAAD